MGNIKRETDKRGRAVTSRAVHTVPSFASSFFAFFFSLQDQSWSFFLLFFAFPVFTCSELGWVIIGELRIFMGDVEEDKQQQETRRLFTRALRWLDSALTSRFRLWVQSGCLLRGSSEVFHRFMSNLLSLLFITIKSLDWVPSSPQNPIPPIAQHQNIGIAGVVVWLDLQEYRLPVIDFEVSSLEELFRAQQPNISKVGR